MHPREFLLGGVPPLTPPAIAAPITTHRLLPGRAPVWVQAPCPQLLSAADAIPSDTAPRHAAPCRPAPPLWPPQISVAMQTIVATSRPVPCPAAAAPRPRGPALRAAARPSVRTRSLVSDVGKYLSEAASQIFHPQADSECYVPLGSLAPLLAARCFRPLVSTLP